MILIKRQVIRGHLLLFYYTISYHTLTEHLFALFSFFFLFYPSLVVRLNSDLVDGVIYSRGDGAVALRDKNKEALNLSKVRTELVGTTNDNPMIHVVNFDEKQETIGLAQMIFDGNNFIFNGQKNKGEKITKVMRDISYVPPFAAFQVTGDIGTEDTKGDIACAWKLLGSHGCTAAVLNNEQTPWIAENLGLCAVIVSTEVHSKLTIDMNPFTLFLNDGEINKPWMPNGLIYEHYRDFLLCNMTEGSYFYMLRHAAKVGYGTRLTIIRL